MKNTFRPANVGYTFELWHNRAFYKAYYSLTKRDFWQPIYSYFVFPVMLLGLRISAVKNQKIKNTLQGHNGLWERVSSQLKNRNAEKKLVWFHVASAGEFLQAQPVMERLMNQGFQCALTVTSISGYNWANRRRDQYPNLILLDYLPLDTQKNTQQLLEKIKPDALVYVKFDLWPNLIWEARKLNIPQILISATLHEKSKRMTSTVARRFYQSVYLCLNQILTVSENDTNRFRISCPEHANIQTVGDTRFDSVLDRKATIPAPQLPDYVKNRLTIVLGSIWPADEHYIFPTLLDALVKYDDLVIIAAPHEITEEHLQTIELVFKDFSSIRFTELNLQSTEEYKVIIVDTVGHLSSLYHYADIAYVGGAFSTGVHNTMEPTAMGVTAIFGPFYQNSPEAMDMVEAKKCYSIKNQIEFKNIFTKLVTNEEFRKKTGLEAQVYINSKAGASDICYNKIKESIACP